MNKEYKYLLELLKAFVHEEPPLIQENTNWDALIRLAEIHSVPGIVGYMSMQYKLCPVPEIAETLRRKCLYTISIFTRRAAQMQQLVQLMNENEIDHILFKGYILKEYYPMPELRSYGDIDFVIRSEDREKCHHLMLEQGFQLKTDWEPVFSYYRDTEFYEIHTDIMEIDVSDKADYRGYFREMWKHAIKVEDHTWNFTPEFHFIYLLTHIAKHIYGSGAGVRMYMDIAVFIRHFGNRMDWKYVKEELEKLELYDFSCVVLTAVKEWFHVDCSMEIEAVSAKVLEEFTTFTLEAGVFGHVNRESGLNKLQHSKGNDEKEVLRFSTLVHRLFPSAATIEKRYTYLQNRHWLLPVAWVHRLLRTREEWGMHVHEAQVILSADSDEVNRLRRIHREIGL